MNARVRDFVTHGKDASFHYADDSGKEWGQGDIDKRAALAIFDAHPEMEAKFREAAKGFLWSLSSERPELTPNQ